MRGYNSLWIRRCSTMQPPCYPSGKNNSKSLELPPIFFAFHKHQGSASCTLIILSVISGLVKLIDLPCIQNQRNPGLLCRLWIRLGNQGEHPGVARKTLCLAVALDLHGAPWSLGHGNPLVLDCASEGCRTSQSSFVSLLPRWTFAPWHTQRPIRIHVFG